jgi:hypothetical protein
MQKLAPTEALKNCPQVKELMDSYVSKSTADVVLLGGDFNAGPETMPGILSDEVDQMCFFKIAQNVARPSFVKFKAVKTIKGITFFPINGIF